MKMDNSCRDYHDQNTNVISEVNLLMKIQTAGKKWDKAPEELVKLREMLTKVGETSWTPKKLGINLLTPNKFRGIVLKRMLMKLYPFDSFWMTDTLDETLHKCLFVCQQLGIVVDRGTIWGQCSVDASYTFWIEILKKIPAVNKAKSEEDMIHEAKTKVIAAVIAKRGKDWDKIIARNFEEKLGTSRLFSLIQNRISCNQQENSKKTRARSTFQMSNSNWRTSFQNVFQENREMSADKQATTTSSLAASLKQESLDMIAMLRHVEKYFSDDGVLQIEKAFEYGDKVCDLIDEFDGYMNANNRGAFRDIDALTNHTDKVIKAMSKLTTAYQDFIAEFQKYFGSGKGDESRFPLSTELFERYNN